MDDNETQAILQLIEQVQLLIEEGRTQDTLLQAATLLGDVYDRLLRLEDGHSDYETVARAQTIVHSLYSAMANATAAQHLLPMLLKEARKLLT